MQNVQMRLPSAVTFGHDIVSSHLGRLAREIGSRAFLVSEAMLHDGNYIKLVSEALKRAGVETMVYDELMSSSPASIVDEIASLARASKAQMVIGLGGMRVLSVARCVANVAVGRTRVGQLFSGEVPKNALPYIEIPSSYRNHLLFRDECVLKEAIAERARLLKIAPNTVRTAIIDTSFTQTLSAKYALSAILDTTLAAIEGFYATESTMFSDTLLLRSISELHGAALMGIRSPSDLRFRYRAAEAGMLTAMGLSVTGQGVGGALVYAINARHSLPKSWVAGILLPHVVDFLTSRNEEKAARIAAAMGESVERILPAEDAPRAARGIRRLLSQLDLPLRLRDLDITLDELSVAAEDAGEFTMIEHVPGGVTPADLQQLVAAAF